MHAGLLLSDPNQPFVLKVHHSISRFARVLLQNGLNGKQKPIVFVSTTCTDGGQKLQVLYMQCTTASGSPGVVTGYAKYQGLLRYAQPGYSCTTEEPRRLTPYLDDGTPLLSYHVHPLSADGKAADAYAASPCWP